MDPDPVYKTWNCCCTVALNVVDKNSRNNVNINLIIITSRQASLIH